MIGHCFLLRAIGLDFPLFQQGLVWLPGVAERNNTASVGTCKRVEG
jgi:hypothetical protein